MKITQDTPSGELRWSDKHPDVIEITGEGNHFDHDGLSISRVTMNLTDLKVFLDTVDARPQRTRSGRNAKLEVG